MRVLVFSGLFPILRNETVGSFVTQRLIVLKKKGIDYRAVAIKLYDSFWLKIIRKILTKNSITDDQHLASSIYEYQYPYYLYDYYDLRRGIVDFLFRSYGEKRILRILRSAINEKIDLIHAHWVYPHGFIAVKLGKEMNIPVIVTAHGSDVHSNPLKNQRSLKRTLFTLDTADRVVFVSEALRELATNLGYSRKNSVVIPNGVDTELIQQLTESSLKKGSLKSNESHIVGYVGNLVPVKRADKLPLIFRRIADRIDVHFIVVGDGYLREQIQRDCSNYKLDVDFVGRVKQNEVFKYMSLMNALVLPSRREGFGCVVIEAQACGVPVVGSNHGGIPEAIGDGGLVVPDGPCFEERFADGVISVLKTPFDSEKLRRRASEYDWQNIVMQEIELYKILLSTSTVK